VNRRVKVLVMTVSIAATLGCDFGKPNPAPAVTTSNGESSPRHFLDEPTSNSPSATESGTPWWRDETSESGVEFTYRNGREGSQLTILESVGGGAALFDFDQDGDVDILIAGGGSISSTSPISVTGHPCGLFRNEGNGRFADVSHLVGGAEHPRYSHGVFVSDFNRDGFPDALITGFSGCTLLRNDAGKRLIDVTAESGLENSDWNTAAAWADVNRDGWPDLFVISYLEWTPQADPSCGDLKQKIRDVCPPQKYPAARQQLFLNNQQGAFSRVEQATEGSGRGKGLGCVSLDLNGDGWLDFYVANDQVDNQLYLGGPTFPLAEVAVQSGTAGSELGVAEGSMGVDAGDYDGDGLPDLWVTNYELEDNSLYHNAGNGLFQHATVRAGLAGIGRPQVGFGTGFGDFDLDGWLDLFVINGHVLYETGRSGYRQSPFLLHNVGHGPERRYRDITALHGGPWFQGRYAGRGAALGDLDNDGDLDLLVVHQNEPVSLLFNQTQPGNWLILDVRGTTSEPNAVGAVVQYQFEGRNLVRHVHSGGGYLSTFDPRILLPAGPSTSLEVTVRWLTGKAERFKNLRPRFTNLIREGSGEPL
jgi:hypothetical protein